MDIKQNGFLTGRRVFTPRVKVTKLTLIVKDYFLGVEQNENHATLKVVQQNEQTRKIINQLMII